jgi:hypothetical protein
MSGQISALLRAGLALKVSQLKLAAHSYIEDRTDHGKNVVKAYAVGAGFYVGAALFALAACFVGLGALFHYVEAHYGPYTAFSVVGGLLVLLAIVLAAIGAAKMNPPEAHYPGLMDRLRVALTGKRVKSSLLPPDAMRNSAAATAPVPKRAAESRPAPVKPPVKTHNPVDAARSTAADVLRASPSMSREPQPTPTLTKAGAAMAVTLIGWALARRLSATSGRLKV